MSITMRPHLFSTLFLGVELWCLYLYRSGHRRAIWILPPLMILWVNLHGAWIMGLATLALFIVGEWLNARTRGEGDQPQAGGSGAARRARGSADQPGRPQLLLYPLGFIGGGERDDALHSGVAAAEFPRADGARLRPQRHPAGRPGLAPTALRLYARRSGRSPSPISVSRRCATSRSTPSS